MTTPPRSRSVSGCQALVLTALLLADSLQAVWSQPAADTFLWTFPPGPPASAAFVQRSGDLKAWADAPLAEDSAWSLAVDRAGRDQLRYTLPAPTAPLDFRRLRLAPFRVVPVATAAAARIAIAAAQPGDAIVLADGIWSAPDNPLDLTFDAVGRPGAPVLLTAATPGGAVFSGPTRLRISGTHVIVSGLKFHGATNTSGDQAMVEFRNSSNQHAQHARLTQTAFIDCNPDSPYTRYHWVSLFGQDNRIDHCHFEGQNHSGVTVVVWVGSAPNRHRIDRNHFAGRIESPVLPGLDRNGWETLRIGTSDVSLNSSQSVVERNLFTACDGEIEIISSKSGDNQYLFNTFRSSAGTLTLRHGDRNRVEGNVFLGNNKSGTGGIRVIGEDHVVVNNIVDGTRGRGGAAITLVAGIEDTPLSGYVEANRALLAHNTLRPNSGYAIHLAEGLGSSSRTRVPVGVRMVANLLVRGSGSDRLVEVSGNATAEWQQNLGHGANLGISVSGLTAADPQLQADPVTGLPAPASGSPAIALASPLNPAVVEDAIGRPRPDPATAGAWEAAPLPTNLPLLVPLTAADVGPSWWP